MAARGVVVVTGLTRRGTTTLTLSPDDPRHVTFAPQTVDNEGMDKRKSKCECMCTSWRQRVPLLIRMFSPVDECRFEGLRTVANATTKCRLLHFPEATTIRRVVIFIILIIL